MSSNNNNAESTAFAFMIAILGIAAMFLFALLAFIVFGMTVLALLAWNKPLQLGKWTIEPEEARAFVLRGVLGAAIAPVFLAFCGVIFDVPINWDYLAHFLGFGYVAGSIGLEILLADQQQQGGAAHDHASSQPWVSAEP